MTQSMDYCALAKAYVEASNNHNLKVIKMQLAADASYVSANVGRFEGIPAIITMMGGFFSTFPNVTWAVDTYVLSAPLSVSFEFSMAATNTQTDEKIQRDGLERIEFAADGKIIHIEVGPRS